MLIANAYALELQDIANSLKNINVDLFYDDYSTLIDFALYLFLFIPLAILTIGKHLTGRHGRMVATAIGIMLAAGLVLMEKTMGFNLRSFGPLAAVLTISGVGLVVFLTLKRMNVHTTTSAGISFLLVFFSFQAISPSLYDWIVEKAPWLSIVLFACILITAGSFLKSAIVGGLWVAGTVRRPTGETGVRFVGRTEESVEEEMHAAKNLKAGIKTEKKNAKRMIQGLQEVKTRIKERKDEKGTITLIRKMEFQDEEMTAQAKMLRQLTERLLSLDVEVYHRMKEQLSGVWLEQQKQNLHDEIHAELNSIQAEKRIEQYEELLEKSAAYVRSYLELAITFLDSREPGRALTVVEKAIESLENIQKEAQQMKHLEKLLERILRKEHATARDETQVVNKAA